MSLFCDWLSLSFTFSFIVLCIKGWLWSGGGSNSANVLRCNETLSGRYYSVGPIRLAPYRSKK